MNAGADPIQVTKKPDVKFLRIFISIVRRAEVDYLSPRTTPEEKDAAARVLFGLHLSPLSGLCHLLGIDQHAARLKLLEWFVEGRTGDPIFGYMTKPKSSDRYERGMQLDTPRL